ncbi:MarR family winged helix-turn-helix transcriptional regulator [Streptomyces sp. SHP 1-2]|uniref:MarR family winged helix-turn-helix transcriptional regulator n=1 Tax=Streptomyces sp. SHP 1-2 TaxID=2769489 RepID=UPI0022388B08|nr:MarR family transcriptional regulator [Streptomyces sp. SHP 1-2]MCW5250312.1 MarR family transcriptional regulator [Streptomyces sp. SHP 1-2]
MNAIDAPLPPDELAHRLTEVYDLVGPLYRRAQRSVEQGLAGDDLAVGVRAVLTLLHRNGPMTVPQMGRAQAISRQFVQRMVNEAAGRGLTESIPNPAHRRSSLIRLTPAGGGLITAVLEREHGLLREVGGGLTDAEVTACLRVLGRMLSALDHVDVD